MSLIRKAFEHVLRQLSVEFSFSDVEGTTMQIILELAEQLPEQILAEVAESHIECENCGYKGAASLISKHMYCKCGMVPQGRFPQLRIFENAGFEQMEGYRLGAIILSSQSILLPDASEHQFDLISRAGVEKMGAESVPDLLDAIQDPVFVKVQGEPEFYFFYRPSITDVSKNRPDSAEDYETLPPVDPAVSVRLKALKTNELEQEASRPPSKSEELSSYATSAPKPSKKAVLANDEIVNYRISRRINVPVSFSINIPSAVMLLILLIVVLQSLIHISVSYAKITQNVFVVNDIVVSNSTFIRNAAVRNSLQFLNQTTEVFPPRVVVTDSMEANSLEVDDVAVQSEYSGETYSFQAAKPKTFTANRFVANNLSSNETAISSAVFATSPETRLNLTRAEFKQLTSLKYARINRLITENITFDQYCQITGVPQNISAEQLNARRLVSDNLGGRLPATPHLTVENAAVGNLSTASAETRKLVVSGKCQLQRCMAASRELDISSENGIPLESVVIGCDAVINSFEATELSSDNSSIERLETENISGEVDISGAISFETVTAGAVDCQTLEMPSFQCTESSLNAGIRLKMESSANESYELSLTSTLIMNLVVAAVIILLFPLLRFLFPVVYSPLHYQKHINTGITGEILWFLDVFLEPLQIYAERGNMTLLFVLLENMFLLLFCFISMLSAFALIPIYYYGHDQYMNSKYLTVWSKMSLVHLEEGSPLVFAPLCAMILICVAVMFVYTEFNIIYIYLREKTAKRVIPENYVLMLSNIPKDINTTGELMQLLNPMSNGIVEVVPSPLLSNQLYFKSQKLLQQAQNLDVISINQQKLNALTLSEKVKRLNQDDPSVDKLLAIIAENDENSRKYFERHEKVRELKRDLIMELRSLQIRPKHFKNHSGYPPRMLRPMDDLLGGASYSDLGAQYPIDKCLSNGVKAYFKEMHLRQTNNITETIHLATPRGAASVDQQIGRFAYVICDTQKRAAEKLANLLTIDVECPKAEIAPAPELVNWENLSISTLSRNVRRVVYIVVLSILFVVYFYLEALLMSVLSKVADDWIIALYETFKGKSCANLNKETIAVAEDGMCGFVQQIASTIVTFVPTIINSFLMSLLPFLLDWTIDILGFATEQQKQEYSFILLFVFLILIQGIVQVAIPQAIQVETGDFDLKLLFEQSFTGFITSLGDNIPKQMFVFINYIIAKYFLFPALGLLNIPNAFFCLLYWLFSKNSIERTERFESFIFKYPKQLAYIAHMIVVSFIFCIVAPLTNIIVLLTYLMMIVTDRYYILYISKPDETTELSHQSRLMKSVSDTLFTGLVFMLVACFAFFMEYSGWEYIFAQVLSVLCLICCCAYKLQFDIRFKRSMNELAHGNYAFKRNLLLNIADNYNGFEDRNSYDKKNSVIQSKRPGAELKNNLLGNWVKRNYCDLEDLPVNYTVFESLKRKETVGYVLDELESEECQLVGDYKLCEEDIRTISQEYSHPAIAFTFGNYLEIE